MTTVCVLVQSPYIRGLVRILPAVPLIGGGRTCLRPSLVPLPFALAELQARLFELLPGPPPTYI